MFVIMETVGDFSRPVATRESQEVAYAYVRELAQERLRSQNKNNGFTTLEGFEDGVRIVTETIVFSMVEVGDCG